MADLFGRIAPSWAQSKIMLSLSSGKSDRENGGFCAMIAQNENDGKKCRCRPPRPTHVPLRLRARSSWTEMGKRSRVVLSSAARRRSLRCRVETVVCTTAPQNRTGVSRIQLFGCYLRSEQRKLRLQDKIGGIRLGRLCRYHSVVNETRCSVNQSMPSRGPTATRWASRLAVQFHVGELLSSRIVRSRETLQALNSQ